MNSVSHAHRKRMPRPPRFDKNRNPITYVIATDATGETLYLHRMVYGDIPEGYDVRHKNGDTMNNTQDNLELYKLKERRVNKK